MADALSYSLRLIKSRLRSVWELDQALLKRGVEPEKRQETIQQLTEAGLLDDRRFAMAWVHTRDRLSPRGEAVLRLELRKRGVADHIIAEALRTRREESEEDPEGQPDEVELAKAVLRGRERSYAHLPPDARLRRQVALLQRRGFSYEVIRRILDM